MPNVKEGVVFWPGMHPRVEAAMEDLDRIHIRVTGKRPAFITSARDGKHAERSKHYAGRALDLRTNDLSTAVKHELTTAIRVFLGSDWFVDLEHEGQPFEHIHLQLNVV